MKNLIYFIAFATVCWTFQSCNNEGRSKDSVELADEANNGADSANYRSVPELGVEDVQPFNDSDFAVKAAAGGLLEVQLGELAVKNASDQAVKDFGQMMVDDHGKANEELKALAKQKEIVLPTAPSRESMEDMRDLNEKKGSDFDKEYIHHMVEEHEADIKLFEMAAENATDNDIKAFASKTLPTLRKHLSAAESLKKTIDEKNQ